MKTKKHQTDENQYEGLEPVSRIPPKPPAPLREGDDVNLDTESLLKPDAETPAWSRDTEKEPDTLSGTLDGEEEMERVELMRRRRQRDRSPPNRRGLDVTTIWCMCSAFFMFIAILALFALGYSFLMHIGKVPNIFADSNNEWVALIFLLAYTMFQLDAITNDSGIFFNIFNSGILFNIFVIVANNNHSINIRIFFNEHI
ncbi:unnamed protein product [Caenorhabditis bovis]|uniref:Uncharacterized protein n=1 Tax=Caenorhabditis bovis TaxID=2654633 RepID=A0A8S1EUD8_9PELO|nr:unnamed protein product [Caenorhabditis bovis]